MADNVSACVEQIEIVVRHQVDLICIAKLVRQPRFQRFLRGHVNRKALNESPSQFSWTAAHGQIQLMASMRNPSHGGPRPSERARYNGPIFPSYACVGCGAGRALNACRAISSPFSASTNSYSPVSGKTTFMFSFKS
jgi:hypothetical protein